jgi:hypothetical protein
VKTEFSAFLRMLPTKELTDTFVSFVLLFFSSIIEFLLGTQGVFEFERAKFINKGVGRGDREETHLL